MTWPSSVSSAAHVITHTVPLKHLCHCHVVPSAPPEAPCKPQLTSRSPWAAFPTKGPGIPPSESPCLCRHDCPVVLFSESQKLPWTSPHSSNMKPRQRKERCWRICRLLRSSAFSTTKPVRPTAGPCPRILQSQRLMLCPRGGSHRAGARRRIKVRAPALPEGVSHNTATERRPLYG